MPVGFPAVGGTRSPPQEEGSHVSLSLETVPLYTFLSLSLTLYFHVGVTPCSVTQHLLLAGRKCL